MNSRVQNLDLLQPLLFFEIFTLPGFVSCFTPETALVVVSLWQRVVEVPAWVWETTSRWDSSVESGQDEREVVGELEGRPVRVGPDCGVVHNRQSVPHVATGASSGVLGRLVVFERGIS